MFYFPVFQQMLKTVLKREGAFAVLFQFYVVRLWKNGKYTPRIHSFNRVFNKIFC